MILALVLCSIALAIPPSFSYPLGMYVDSAQGFDLATDFDPYYPPWNYGNRWWGSTRGLWPYDGYGDFLDYDYGYGSPPVRTIDVGRDRVVRDFAVTETDNWVRDQTTYRAPPRFRSAPWPARRIFASGLGGPRTSSLRNALGESFYMRR